MSQAGLLVQVDGSRHDWLEGRGPWLTLIGEIDDATGVVVGAVFREQEDAVGYLQVLRTALDHGLPVAVYRDRHGIFEPETVPTLTEQFAGRAGRRSSGEPVEPGIAWIPPGRHRPRAASNDCGARSRTGVASCAWPAPSLESPPTGARPVPAAAQRLVRRAGRDPEPAWRTAS